MKIAIVCVPLSIVMMSLLACQPENHSVKNSSSSKPFRGCAEHFKHDDPDIAWAYQEAFTMFGAYLLKYQDVLNKGLNTEEEFNGIDLFKDIKKEGKFFDVAINQKNIGDLSKIDTTITHEKIRPFWESWCRYPDNFLSWLLIPVRQEKATSVEELKQKTFSFGHGLTQSMIMWNDDGFWIFSKLVGITIKGSPFAGTLWQAEPKKWLIEIVDGKAITKEAS